MNVFQSGTKGGESFGNTDQEPAQQEGSETIYQSEREVHHPGGIGLLHPFGTESQEHNP